MYAQNIVSFLVDIKSEGDLDDEQLYKLSADLRDWLRESYQNQSITLYQSLILVAVLGPEPSVYRTLRASKPEVITPGMILDKQALPVEDVVIFATEWDRHQWELDNVPPGTIFVATQAEVLPNVLYSIWVWVRQQEQELRAFVSGIEIPHEATIPEIGILNSLIKSHHQSLKESEEVLEEKSFSELAEELIRLSFPEEWQQHLSDDDRVR